MSLTDDKFRDRLQQGVSFQQHVADYLAGWGIEVKNTGYAFRETRKDADLFKDEKDLICNGFPVDVKSRSLTFQGRRDFPYPTAMVDTVWGWDRKAEKPLAVVVISQKTGGMFVIPSHTEEYWEKRSCRDRYSGNWEWNYECPMALTEDIGWLIEELTWPLGS